MRSFGIATYVFLKCEVVVPRMNCGDCGEDLSLVDGGANYVHSGAFLSVSRVECVTPMWGEMLYSLATVPRELLAGLRCLYAIDCAALGMSSLY